MGLIIPNLYELSAKKIIGKIATVFPELFFAECLDMN